MRRNLIFLVAAPLVRVTIAIALLTMSGSLAQSACAPGFVPASALPGAQSGCMPAGSVDCGGGKSCPRGTFCSPRGGCVAQGQNDCGNYYCPAGTTCIGGGRCGGGSFNGPVCGGPVGDSRGRCLTGWRCGPDDQCYDPKVTFYCGRERCLISGSYDRSNVCGCRSPAQSAPTLTAKFPPPKDVPNEVLADDTTDMRRCLAKLSYMPQAGPFNAIEADFYKNLRLLLATKTVSPPLRFRTWELLVASFRAARAIEKIIPANPSRNEPAYRDPDCVVQCVFLFRAGECVGVNQTAADDALGPDPRLESTH
jgi:hypothetical protein